MRPFAGRVPDLGRFGVATAVPFVAGLILGDDLPKLQCRCAGDAKRSALEADRAPPEAAGGSWSGVGEPRPTREPPRLLKLPDPHKCRLSEVP